MTGKFSSGDKKAQCHDDHHLSTCSVPCTWEFFNLNEKYQVWSAFCSWHRAKGACPVFQKCPSLPSHWLGTGVWQEGDKPLSPCWARLPPGSTSSQFWIFQLKDILHSETFQNKFTVITDNEYFTDHLSRPLIFINKKLDPQKSKMNSQNLGWTQIWNQVPKYWSASGNRETHGHQRSGLGSPDWGSDILRHIPHTEAATMNTSEWRAGMFFCYLLSRWQKGGLRKESNCPPPKGGSQVGPSWLCFLRTDPMMPREARNPDQLM